MSALNRFYKRINPNFVNYSHEEDDIILKLYAKKQLNIMEKIDFKIDTEDAYIPLILLISKIYVKIFD